MRRGLKSKLLFGSALCLVGAGQAAAQAPAQQPTAAELTRQMEEAERQRDAAERQRNEAEERAEDLRQRATRAAIDEATAEVQRRDAAAAEARTRLASLTAASDPPPVAAQPGTVVTETSHPDGTRVVERRPITQADLAGSETGSQTFGGIEFGVGMAFSLDLGDRDRVRDAQLVNGIVRVSRGDNVRARLILETHYFFTPQTDFPLFGICNPSRRRSGTQTPSPNDCASDQPMWGWGPFIAVQPGSDNIIDAIGAGLMVGLRRPGEGSQSFNIGVGILYDMDVQLLGDGIFENEPLPPGETEIRYRREAQSGLMVMSSYSF